MSSIKIIDLVYNYYISLTVLSLINMISLRIAYIVQKLALKNSIMKGLNKYKLQNLN